VSLVFIYHIVNFINGLIVVADIVGWCIYIAVVSTIIKLFYQDKSKPSYRIPVIVSSIIGCAIGALANTLFGLNNNIYGMTGAGIGVMCTFLFLVIYDRTQIGK
jgi:hypothetical protein